MNLKTLPLLVAFSAAMPSLRAELIDLYFEAERPYAVDFIKGRENWVKIGNPPPGLRFEITAGSADSFVGLTGGLGFDGQIGPVEALRFSQTAPVESLVSGPQFYLEDGAGTRLTGELATGSLFKNTHHFDLRLNLTDLTYTGHSEVLQRFAQADQLLVQLPLFLVGENRDLDDLLANCSPALAFGYDGFITGCIAPIPEFPWAALSLGTSVAILAWTRRRVNPVAAS